MKGRVNMKGMKKGGELEGSINEGTKKRTKNKEPTRKKKGDLQKKKNKRLALREAEGKESVKRERGV